MRLFVWTTEKDEEVYTLIQGRLSPLHITNPVAFIVFMILLGALVMICESDQCMYTEGIGAEYCIEQKEYCEANPQGTTWSGYECK